MNSLQGSFCSQTGSCRTHAHRKTCKLGELCSRTHLTASFVQGKVQKNEGPAPVKKKRKIQPEAMQPGPKPIAAVSRPDASLPHTQQAQGQPQPSAAPPAPSLSLAALAAAAGQALCSHSTSRLCSSSAYAFVVLCYFYVFYCCTGPPMDCEHTLPEYATVHEHLLYVFCGVYSVTDRHAKMESYYSRESLGQRNLCTKTLHRQIHLACFITGWSFLHSMASLLSQTTNQGF